MNASLLIIMDQYENPRAGTEGQVLKLLSGLVSRGVKVRFVVFRDSEYVHTGQFPVPIEVLNIQRIASLKSVWALVRLAWSFRREGGRLAHIFFNDASVIAPPIFKLFGIRNLISRRDMGFWYTGVHRRLLPWTGCFADGVICNSQAVATVTKKQERFADEKIHVIYNGYPEFTSVPPVPDLHHSDSEKLIVGLVANLRPIKRIGDLLEAVARITSNTMPLELHIVGGGDTEALCQRAKELNIESMVYFWGSQGNVDAFVAGFDIATLCSESEGFSNSIIEYMRNGKPVICTNVGGNPEIVEHGINGFLYPVGDIDALAGHLQGLVNNPEKRRSMGMKGREKVARAYSIEHMLNQHLELYQSMSPAEEWDYAR